MAGKARIAREVHEHKPDTLGALLYSNPRAPIPDEGEWLDLIRSVAAGDQLALHALYQRAHRLVFTLTLRMTSNRQTADELTVDVFHGVWQHAAQYDPASGPVLGWILNQARWRTIDRLRFDGRQKRAQPPEHEDLRAWTPPRDSEDAIVFRQQADVLRKALATLTPDERNAIETAYFSDLTYGEVAEKLNQPLGTIKTRIRSALGKLREALAQGVEP